LYADVSDTSAYKIQTPGNYPEEIIQHEISKRKPNWIGHILRRNCLLQQVIEGKIEVGIEVTRRRGRRRGKLLDDINPLKAELNPICHLLALLGAHHILHVSRIRVKERRGYSSFEGGSSRSHYVESWLWTRLRTCRKTLLNE